MGLFSDKKYAFSFGRLHRGELQQIMEDTYTQYQYRPLDGAQKVLDMFSKPQDVAILKQSKEVQDVVMGSGSQQGSIGTLLEWATERLNPENQQEQARLLDLTYRYGKLLAAVDTEKAFADDPKGTKRYDFSFGTMTGGELQQEIEDKLSQYAGATGRCLDGAERLLDMFSSPQDKQIIAESAAVRHRVFGCGHMPGPVDFLLTRAEEGAGHGDKVRIGQLRGRLDSLQAETCQSDNRLPPKLASFTERAVSHLRQSRNGERSGV